MKKIFSNSALITMLLVSVLILLLSWITTTVLFDYDLINGKPGTVVYFICYFSVYVSGALLIVSLLLLFVRFLKKLFLRRGM
jgi:hypothetical protein